MSSGPPGASTPLLAVDTGGTFTDGGYFDCIDQVRDFDLARWDDSPESELVIANLLIRWRVKKRSEQHELKHHQDATEAADAQELAATGDASG